VGPSCASWSIASLMRSAVAGSVASEVPILFTVDSATRAVLLVAGVETGDGKHW
jgi:hypothetical protein